MLPARERLEKFLAERSGPAQNKIEQWTPDASTREYFRINGKPTAIACVYPAPDDPQEASYLDVTGLFQTAGLPVAEIYEINKELAIIVHEDFGDKILRDVLETASDSERDEWLDRSITLIAEIQTATEQAFARNSIASRLRFDEEKLLWELNFFKTHYFETLKNTPLSEADSSALDAEFAELGRELSGRAKVLAHRDFHAANLMIDRENHLHIIDHQDARIGSASYDLVSLLLDRVVKPPAPEWLAEKRRFFLDERERLGLEKLDEADFAHEFRLQTIQRCLKAVGTFSFQSATRGKTYFIQYIDPMLQIVLRAVENLERFPALQMILRKQLKDN